MEDKKMKHFAKPLHYGETKYCNYRFLITGCTEWQLWRYSPYPGESSLKSGKYRLGTIYFDDGGKKFVERAKVRSIQEAENLINQIYGGK